MKTKLGLLLLCLSSVFIGALVLATDFSKASGSAPIYQIDSPPVEVTVDELCDAYFSEAATIETSYYGKRLLLAEVEVIDIQAGNYYSGGRTQSFKISFTNGNTRFELRDLLIMQSVEVGYILNIVGTCRGISRDRVLVSDCWVESVVGDIGLGELSIGY